MVKLNDAHRHMIGKIATECALREVTLLLQASERVKLPEESADMASSGFFDDAQGILAVGTMKPVVDWFPVLLHEYSHMRQWIEDPRGWAAAGECEELWDWLDGSLELTKAELRRTVDSVRGIETDCEQRTIRLIEENPEFGIDPGEYGKKANAYMYFYTMVARERKWYTKKPPYTIPGILKMMPSDMPRDYWRVPKQYQELVRRHCF